jgi:hypothetical protein
MIDVKDIATISQSAICIALIIVVLFKFWSIARLDAFRQKMFAIRDELFDFAAEGNISFDDPAYRLLRQSMNGIIRYAHQLSFFRVCVTGIEVALEVKVPKNTWSEAWGMALENVHSDEVRKKLEEFHANAMQAIFNRLILGSPLLLGLVICSIPILMLRMGWQNLKVILLKAPSFTVSHVVDTRMIENEAAGSAVA